MSISMNTSSPALQNTDTAHGIKTAKLVKNQTEVEGKMALDLIQSASIDPQLAAPVGNVGNNINIKV